MSEILKIFFDVEYFLVDSKLLDFLYFFRFLPTFEIVTTFLSFCDFLQMYGIFYRFREFLSILRILRDQRFSRF